MESSKSQKGVRTNQPLLFRILEVMSFDDVRSITKLVSGKELKYVTKPYVLAHLRARPFDDLTRVTALYVTRALNKESADRASGEG